MLLALFYFYEFIPLENFNLNKLNYSEHFQSSPQIDDSLPLIFESICLSPHRRAFGPAGVSFRKLSQSLEPEGHPRHV